MKFPPLQPGILIERINRFSALVQLDGGKTTTAYVPTTGRLTGALYPGCRVWMEQAHNPGRKTAFTLLLSELPGGGLCSVKATMANTLFAEAVSAGLLAAFPFTSIEKEVTYGHSRLDFRLSSPETVCWVEVKSVTFVENGMGMFPDAPTYRDYDRTTTNSTSNLVEILRFKHFTQKIYFTPDGNNFRNKVINNHVMVRVVLDLGCGYTSLEADSVTKEPAQTGTDKETTTTF